ncbi:PREDICTED: uncharacterized protein LOC109209690 [Nicotiana attenuata]|uniref:uncharacterized protein LOC109209690 n=1 Tax=Nicotiana attenuata TaxID=49451 RepID=UPI0009052D7F|nr:PREDICTED: uncharacterized protein LOC109209690 [Nicotiana attenuata]
MAIGTVTPVANKGISESSSVPLYSTRASLVSAPFDNTCYGSWRRNIPVALLVRNKLDFINGTTERPPDGSPFSRQWQRYYDLVVSWLTNSLTKEISRSVEYLVLAKDIWNELEERYGKTDGARIFELKKDLAHIPPGSLDIASYYNKIKQLRDEITSISVNYLTVCTCGENKKVEEEQKVYQFLMGLNETYLQVRSNTIMLKILPSMNIVYSILLSDEKQRQVSSASHFSSSSTSFNVGFSKQNFHSKLSFDSPKSCVTCKYCKKQGHTTEKCYKSLGFPPNFKFSKGTSLRKMASNAEVDKSGLLGTPGGSDDHPQSQSKQLSAVPSLTKELIPN